MRIGVYVDVPDLYGKTKVKYHTKIDYKKYLEYVSDFGELVSVKAYVRQYFPNERVFFDMLKKYGYTVVRKKPDESIVSELISNLVMEREQLDMVILGVSSGDYAPVMNILQDKRVIVFGCSISEKLGKATMMEIPPSVLVNKYEIVETVNA